MPPRFSQALLDEIMTHLDIVDVVSGHVSLKKQGKDFAGLCPFHAEKTPSFTVSREKQLFYCFGCQAGGNIFTFLMRKEGLAFGDAVDRLARQAGLDPASYAASPAEKRRLKERDELLAANRTALAHYSRCLQQPVGRKAQAYLEWRGISPEMVERFRLGYAPPGDKELLDVLKQEGVSEATALKAGILAQRDPKREPYPRFFDRLMFPIRDAAGRPVGFGGRQLEEGARGPKYLNSPETPLFSKRNQLYGLAEGQDAIRRADQVLLVEGYTDVISLHQFGIKMAVASLGTAFTADQARLLARYAQEAVIAYDADSSGQAAAERGLDILAEAGLRVRVVILPGEADPDTFVREQGAAAMQRAVEEARPLTDYKLWLAMQGADLNNVEGKARLVTQVVPILARVDSLVEREAYISQVAARLGVSVESVAGDVARFEEKAGKPRKSRDSFSGNSYNKKGVGRPRGESRTGDNPQRGRKSDPLAVAEAALVRHALTGPGAMDSVLGMLQGEGFSQPVLDEVIRHLQDLREREGGFTPQSAVTQAEDTRLAGVITRLLAADEGVGSVPVEAYARRVRRLRLRSRLQALEAEVVQVEEQGHAAGCAVLGNLLVRYKQLRDHVQEELVPQ